MRDVRAVDWLPIGEAVERLSRGYERAFLEKRRSDRAGRGERRAGRGQAPDACERRP